MDIRVQPAQPVIAFLGRARVFVKPQDHRAKYYAHGIGRSRIANQNLVAPFWIKRIIPIAWRFSCSNRIAVINDYFGSLVSAVPTILWIARRSGDLVSPGWTIGSQEVLFGGRLKRCVRSSPPQICLGSISFGPHALEDLARAHIQKLHVCFGMRLL